MPIGRPANRLRTDTCDGQKGAEALGFPGKVRERGNREFFGDFSGDTGLFHCRRLPFRNGSPLGFY